MMGISSLQVCMDTSDDWLQGTIPQDQITEMDSSAAITPISYSEEEIVMCSRPLIERRLRPQQEQSQKCPRCESTHTKFCYYNNYSLSQPRFFCKTCRRYWTKGGTLRNIPVGGGCRKNKKTSSSSKKSSSSSSPNDIHHNQSSPSLNLHPQEIPDLHLAFPEQIRFPPHFNNFETGPFSIHGENPSYLIENPTPINFMESKYDALLRISHDFLGINNKGGLTENNYGVNCSAFGSMSSLEGNYRNSSPTAAPRITILESSQNLMLPNYENFQHLNHNQEGNVKPSSKILSIEWNDHQQACNSDAGIGSWTGLMNGFGVSATDYSLV